MSCCPAHPAFRTCFPLTALSVQRKSSSFSRGSVLWAPGHDPTVFSLPTCFLEASPVLMASLSIQSPPPPTWLLIVFWSTVVLSFFLEFTVSSASSGEGNGTPLQDSCLENPMDGGAWWAAVHGVGKSQTRLSDFTFTFHFHALEKEMATHSSVLAWRIPGTGEPGGCRLWGRTESDTTDAT